MEPRKFKIVFRAIDSKDTNRTSPRYFYNLTSQAAKAVMASLARRSDVVFANVLPQDNQSEIPDTGEKI